jgi:hypothetical protein
MKKTTKSASKPKSPKPPKLKAKIKAKPKRAAKPRKKVAASAAKSDVPTITFEESIKRIDVVISKLRQYWKLTAIAWMDFDDVSQKLRLHLMAKWALWDQTKALEPWVYRTCRNQIKNMVRNVYYGSARPCLDCIFNQGGDQCQKFGTQNSQCRPFAKWEKTKKHIYNSKFPSSIHDTHDSSGLRSEVCSLPEQNINFDVIVPVIDAKLRKVLKPNELVVYELFYLKNFSEQQVAARLGFKLDEGRKNPRCKQFQNIKKSVIEKAKLVIRSLV